MLGVIPHRRKNAGTVIASGAWNLLVLIPFVLAFWILTQTHHAGAVRAAREGRINEAPCTGIVWDVANFARWAFLGFVAYTLLAIPLNIINIAREKKAHGAKTHEWLRMFDALHWLANWALFFYLVTGLANRGQCRDHKITSLLWATVFISVFFGLIWFFYTFVCLIIFAVRAIDDIRQETKAGQTLETHGGVEVLDIKKAGMHQNIMTGNRMRTEPGRDIEGGAVLDKVGRDGYERELGTKSEVPLGDPRRERFEPVNIRDGRGRQEHSIERVADYDDSRPTDNRVIRNLETHGSQMHSKY